MTKETPRSRGSGSEIGDISYDNARVADSDELLRKRVVELVAIDRAVRRYHLKLEGELPWSEFETPDLREAA